MGWLFTEAKNLIDYVARGVELAAAVIIAMAALEATIKALSLFVSRGAPPEAKNAVRLSFARWLALGLEFELAADILRTAITPTWNDIEQLAAIAALRTALNYFLAKEIEKESSMSQRDAERRTLGTEEGDSDTLRIIKGDAAQKRSGSGE
jgi:uncharacterized membrane protein